MGSAMRMKEMAGRARNGGLGRRKRDEC